MPAPALPSASAGDDTRTTPVALTSAKEWASSGLRPSFFMLIMGIIVLLGVWTLAPTVGAFVDQRAKIAAVEAQIDVTNDRIAELERERDRWHDPAYVTTQARERLYYVRPGETVYLIDNDLDVAALGLDPEIISADVVEADDAWSTVFLRSLVQAGSSRAVTTVE